MRLAQQDAHRLKIDELMKDQVLPPNFFFKTPLNWQFNWFRNFEPQTGQSVSSDYKVAIEK
jgi:hypothetical protein